MTNPTINKTLLSYTVMLYCIVRKLISTAYRHIYYACTEMFV